jgi:formate-dependent phosphoribosylglycinamide formyltransferase (GAR transformylase)
MSPSAMLAPSARRTRVTLSRRLRRLLTDDAGMSTVEYAIGTVAAAAFGAALYAVVTGDSVVTALTELIQRALSVTF